MLRPFSIGSIGFALRMTSKFDIDFEFSETSFLFKSNTKGRQISTLSSRYKKKKTDYKADYVQNLHLKVGCFIYRCVSNLRWQATRIVSCFHNT